MQNDVFCPFTKGKCRNECEFISAGSCILAEAPLSAMEIETKLDAANEKLDEITDALAFISKQLHSL